jgi:hypothetical protein
MAEMLDCFPHHQIIPTVFLQPFVRSSELIDRILSLNKIDGRGRRNSRLPSKRDEPLSTSKNVLVNLFEKAKGLGRRTVATSRPDMKGIEVRNASESSK